MADLLCVQNVDFNVESTPGEYGGSCTGGFTNQYTAGIDCSATVDSALSFAGTFEVPRVGVKGVATITWAAGSTVAFGALCTETTIDFPVKTSAMVTISRKIEYCYLAAGDLLTPTAMNIGPISGKAASVAWV